MTDEVALSPSAQMFQQMLAQSGNLKDLDVEKVEALLKLQQQLILWQREEAYTRAFNALEPELPEIDQNGQIIVKGKLRSRYSRFEDIMAVIKEPVQKHGFSLTFNTPSTGDLKEYLITLEVLHVDGHKKPYEILLPVDTSDFRSPVQNVSSSISFGRRILLKNAFNLVEKGQEEAPISFITEEQVKDLHIMIQDGKADLRRFLTHFQIEKLEDLPTSQYQEAVADLEKKVARRREEAAAKEAAAAAAKETPQ